MTRRKSKKLAKKRVKSCPRGKIRNPKTGRFVKKSSVIGKKILARRKSVKKRKSKRKSRFRKRKSRRRSKKTGLATISNPKEFIEHRFNEQKDSIEFVNKLLTYICLSLDYDCETIAGDYLPAYVHLTEDEENEINNKDLSVDDKIKLKDEKRLRKYIIELRKEGKLEEFFDEFLNYDVRRTDLKEIANFINLKRERNDSLVSKPSKRRNL